MNRPATRAAAANTAAAVEVLLATALVVVAVRWWHRGVVAATETCVPGGCAELFQVDGRWWSAAVLAVTVAGLLLIDAARRVARPLHQRGVRAARWRRRRVRARGRGD